MATATEAEREAWRAGGAVNPDREQAQFGAGVPPAAELGIDEINPLNPHLFREDRWHDHFARLRAEDPVHFNELGSAGRYWSVTRWADVREVESDDETFCSAHGITVGPPADTDLPPTTPLNSFITMDAPEHRRQRRTVQPMMAPTNLRNLEGLIRERATNVLDSLPEGETFDWVDTVSVELTTLMLATLFDFPLEDRRKLTRWSDLVTTIPGPEGIVETSAQRREEFSDCLPYFERLWEERRTNPGNDMISMLVHGEATSHLPAAAHLGNLILLIVGGNDTTRNSISGGVLALNQFPGEYDKLRADPSPKLIGNMVSEIIRWQTPLAYMLRTAVEDTDFCGQRIRTGDRLCMWYVSGNRDDEVIDNPNDFIIDRRNARHHLSFGFGIHRCMGNRLAEMQLRVLWEEIMKRFRFVEVVGEPVRTLSAFVKGYLELPVRVHEH
ncbi:MAG: cytochrome P450 [Gammaproteobacteria bacterium]|nr:cytochrome P450 [Gammaproteobacteria bacterium]